MEGVSMASVDYLAELVARRMASDPRRSQDDVVREVLAEKGHSSNNPLAHQVRNRLPVARQTLAQAGQIPMDPRTWVQRAGERQEWRGLNM